MIRIGKLVGPDLWGRFAEASIAGLYWKYYSDDMIFVHHPQSALWTQQGQETVRGKPGRARRIIRQGW